MKSSNKPNEQIIDDWVHLRRKRQLQQTASPFFEERVMTQILTQPISKKSPATPTPSTLPLFPKILTTSLCTTLGITKFYLILQLTF